MNTEDYRARAADWKVESGYIRNDVEDLADEVDRLREQVREDLDVLRSHVAEIERLRALSHDDVSCIALTVELRREVERLRAENEYLQSVEAADAMLRDALAEIERLRAERDGWRADADLTTSALNRTLAEVELLREQLAIAETPQPLAHMSCDTHVQLAHEEIERLRAEMVKMGRDHSVRLQVRDEEEERLRAELAEMTARAAKAENDLARSNATGEWSCCREAEAEAKAVSEKYLSMAQHAAARKDELAREVERLRAELAVLKCSGYEGDAPGIVRCARCTEHHTPDLEAE